MYTGIDTNKFTKCEKIENMIVYGDITMKDIYSMYEETEKRPKYVTFFNERNDLFSFQIEKESGYDILKKPIEINIKEQKIEIISSTQVDFIKEKYKVDKFSLEDNKNEYFIFNLNNLVSQRNKKLNFIEKPDNDMFNNQNEIELFLKPYVSKYFINEDFSSPKNFEKNYQYYFDINNKYLDESNFTIYEDVSSDTGYLFSSQINKCEFGITHNYYGSTGKGKSITLIGALKYGQKPSNVGTFYINCKTLRVLFRQNKKKIIIQILIDELVFLLRNRFNDYVTCCEKVKNFLYLNEYDFWTLIEEILDYINKIEGYYFIIAFDQYNDENDINRRLEAIKTRNKINKKFKIIVFSSMNETDIRNIKIKYLFSDKNEIENESNDTEEIKDICPKFFTNFEKEEARIFNLLGGTMKAYNEIKHYKIKYESLNDFLAEKKKKIIFKMFCFYENIKEKKNYYYENYEIDFNKHIGRILSFVPNEEYTKTKLKEIIKNIPFRFFDVEKNNMNYVIKYSCPIVEQILIEIYKEFLLKNNFKRIKELTKGSGAFGCIFKYAVITYILKASLSERKMIFNYFKISKNLKVKKFILNQNEKLENLIFEQQELEIQYDYIIEQEVFCGKTLDFLLIRFINMEPYVYGFQVSIYKSRIYDQQELEDAFEGMIRLLKEYFDKNFKKENMYFGYIFNYEEIKEERYKNMLEKCDNKSLKYCFFEPYIQKFLDNKGKEIQNINDVIYKVFQKEPKPIKHLDDYLYYPLKINYPGIDLELNNEQFKNVKSIVKNNFRPNADWKIIKCTNYDEYQKSYNNPEKYFFLCYDDHYFKVVLFNGGRIYNLLLNGAMERAYDLKTNLKIYVCEVIADVTDKLKRKNYS